MSKDPTNGKASRAVVGQAPFQLTQAQAKLVGRFELTQHQASLLLALETGQILDKEVVDQVLQIHRHRPHWVRVIKATLYGPGFVVSAKSTRLGRIAAKRALLSIELEAVRGVLRKEQAAGGGVGVGVAS